MMLLGAPHVVARTIASLGAPQGLTFAIAPSAPASGGVPDQSGDVPSFSSGSSSPAAPAGNVDRPQPTAPPSFLAAAPSPAAPCNCPSSSFPWWAWLTLGTMAGGTAYGVTAYLLNK